MHILRDRLCNIQAEKFSFGHGRIVNISNLMNRELENIYIYIMSKKLNEKFWIQYQSTSLQTRPKD